MARRALLPCCLFLLAVASSTPAHASEPIERWQVTTQVDLSAMRLPNMPNMPPGFQMPTPPAHVQEVCTPRRADAAPIADHDGRCRVSEVTREGNRQTAHLDCGANSMNGTLELVYDAPDHYIGHMIINPDRAEARARLPSGAVRMFMEGRRIGMCAGGDAQEQAKQDSGTQKDAQDCNQSALAAEFESFVGEHPRCQDRTALQTFCGAVQQFDGFLRAATQEADALAPGAGRATAAAIAHPLTLAAQLCAFKIPDLRLDLCRRAEAAGKFDFLIGQCTAQSQSLAQRLCPVGAAPAPGAAEFCAKYASRAGSNAAVRRE